MKKQSSIHAMICLNTAKQIVNHEKILQAVLNEFNVSKADFESTARKREFVTARQYFSMLCRDLTNLTLKQIGLAAGKRDHATVLHQISTLTDIFSYDHSAKMVYQNLKSEALGEKKPFEIVSEVKFHVTAKELDKIRNTAVDLRDVDSIPIDRSSNNAGYSHNRFEYISH
jgi:hypothetical protein